MIYFVEGGEFIKIGYAQRPKKRLNSMQTANPYKLRIILLIAGDVPDEERLHMRFAKYHYRGEWFRKCPEFLAEMELVKREAEIQYNAQTVSIVNEAMRRFSRKCASKRTTSDDRPARY